MVPVICCLVILTAYPRVPAAQGVANVEISARNGNFQQAFAQSRAVVVVAPTLDGITQLRAVFTKYPKIQQAGVSTISGLIDSAQTEQDLLGAQSELRYFVKLVNFVICEPGALKALQTRFAAAVSGLILNGGIPVTFESNLLADWTASTGSDLDDALERRIYQNTMANIAARDRRDTPSELMTERLFQYLLRHDEARADALNTLKTVQWMARDLDGAMRLVYPELAKQRRAELGLPEPSTPAPNEIRQLGSSLGPGSSLPPTVGPDEGPFGESFRLDTKGVEFGPWVRRFLAQVRRNWIVPTEASSLRGHVSVSFNVHRDGTITDIVVVGPSKVEVLDTLLLNAIAASSPVQPLPAEYPDEKAPITITVYYNPTPPQK